MKLNRSDLIDHLAARSGILPSEAGKYLDNLQAIITEVLQDNGLVSWSGFGRFSTFQTKETIRRNPATGEMMTVPAHRRAKFRIGEKLKRSLL
jgi:DNA-binding protein HU-beta